MCFLFTTTEPRNLTATLLQTALPRKLIESVWAQKWEGADVEWDNGGDGCVRVTG